MNNATGMIFDQSEQELIDAAKLILADGVNRLLSREGLFPTNKDRDKASREKFRLARQAIVDKLIVDYGSRRTEVAVCVLIDAQGRLIAIEEFPNQSRATSCEVSARVLCGFILRHEASAILLAHNHPSGDNTPSREDMALTTMYKSWLKVMDVDLLDHLVLNGEGASTILGTW